MNKVILLAVLLALSACSSPPQTTNILITTTTAPLTAEARLYSQSIRDSITALNEKDFSRYQASFHPDSPEQSSLRTYFDLLIRENAQHRFLGAEVQEVSATQVKMRVEQNLLQGATAEQGYYIYDLRPIGNDWKIFQHAPESAAISASSSPTPPAATATTTAKTELEPVLKNLVQDSTEAINQLDYERLVASFHPESEIYKNLKTLFETIKKTS